MAGGWPTRIVDGTGQAYDLNLPSVVVGTIAHGVADDGSAPGKIGGRVYATSPTLNDGQRSELTFDTRGHAGFTLFAANSNSAIGGGTTARAMGTTTNRLAVYSVGARFNGLTYDHDVKPSTYVTLDASAASTNLTAGKTAPCDLMQISGYNARTSPVWLKLWDKAAAPVIGTDTVISRICLPPGTFNIGIPALTFRVGLAYGLTVNPAASDTTALTANDIIGLSLMLAL